MLEHVQRLLLLIMYSVSLRGVCMCVSRGIYGVIWLSKTGSLEMLTRWSCRGWLVKLLPASLTFTNTTSCTGTTSVLQHGQTCKHTFSNFTLSLCLDKTKCQYIPALLSFKLIIIFRCPFSIYFQVIIYTTWLCEVSKIIVVFTLDYWLTVWHQFNSNIEISVWLTRREMDICQKLNGKIKRAA